MFKHKFEYREGEWFAPPISPDDSIDFELDFIEFLALRREDDGEYVLDDEGNILLADELDEVLWTAEPTLSLDSTITIVTAALSHTERTAKVWIKDAEIGEIYRITASVTTTGNRHFSRSFKTVCRKR